jgi:catechol 2,3-dioxygenase-like lactoylglutathione lyase family enzyme
VRLDYDLHYGALLADLRGLLTRFGDGAVDAPATSKEPFYPSLVTAKFHETWDFYTEKLGFRTVCECGDYVHLEHASGAQLGLLSHEVDGGYAELVSATDGRGFWINLEVPNADAECARLSAAGVEIVTDIADKSWGDRQFVVRDPNGVLISIAHRLAGSSDTLASAAVA